MLDHADRTDQGSHPSHRWAKLILTPRSFMKDLTLSYFFPSFSFLTLMWGRLVIDYSE